MLLLRSVVYSFVWLSTIPLYGGTTISLPIHLPVHIWVVSSF